ncbi:MAG: glycosyl transferase, partial [Casimicrobium sp.]
MALHVVHYLDNVYDLFTSLCVRFVRPQVVVCYENSAHRTFRQARRIHALCVLDAASVHYKAAHRWGLGVLQDSPHWVLEQKRQEIELADLILTCSDLARQTYLDAGVSPQRVVAVNLGTSISNVVPVDKKNEPTIRFVFCGAATRLKGFDLLIRIFSDFEAQQVDATLTVIGGGGDKDLATTARTLSNVKLLPFMAQTD